MKLLIISENYHKDNFGGAELQIKNIIDYFLKNHQNVEVHYIYLTRKNELYDDNIKLYAIKRNKFLEMFFDQALYFFKIKKIIESISPDFIYHRNLSNIALPAISFSNSIDFALHIASPKDLNNKLNITRNVIKSFIKFYGKQKIIRKATYIIAQAKYQDKILKDNYGLKASLVINNGQPIPNIDFEKDKRIKVVWVANLREMKQPEIFIQLAEYFKDRDVEFIMIGRDPKNNWSTDLIKIINRTKNLTYLGELTLDKVNSLIAKSHIFVNTSTYEGFPNTFIQAWMRKVPVVSLNVDPDDVIKNNKLGFHSKSFDKMKIDLSNLIDSPELLETLSDNAYRYGINNYSCDNFEGIYKLMNNANK